MGEMPMNPVSARPTTVYETTNSTNNNKHLLRLLIALCIVNVLMVIFTLISIGLIYRVKNDVFELGEQSSNLRQNLEKLVGSSSNQNTGKVSKSVLIRGFNTTDGFNITLEIPDDLATRSGGSSESNCEDFIKALENLRKDFEGGHGGGTSVNSNNEVLTILQDIKASQANILEAFKTSSAGSQTAALQRLESTVVQRTTSIENRMGDIETIILDSKSQTGILQRSVATLQTDISKIKLDVSLMKIEVTSIKNGMEALSAKSDCAADLTPALTSLKTSVQNMGTKTDKMQKDVAAMVSGDKSLSSIAKTVSAKVDQLDSSTLDMKSQCANTENKLAEVLVKVGVPIEPSTVSYTQVSMSYCSSHSGCAVVRVPTTHCYYISSQQDSSWYAAREACRVKGGYLLEIQSELESKQVAKMVAREGIYWMGASDLAVESRWQWNESGRSVSMNAWKEKEPYSYDSSYDCMALSKDGWSWFVKPCDQSYGYICEKEAIDCDDWSSN